MLNKKSFTSILLVSALVLAIGCSNNVTINQGTNTVGKNQTDDIENKDNFNEQNATKHNKYNTSSDINKRNPSDKNLDINNTLVDPFKGETALLMKIKELASKGEIINCDFKAKETNIATVEDKWGEAVSTEFIKEAKGTYSDYPEHNVAFGWNKGMQIFEARTFDKSLNTIPYSLVEKVYGKPEYTSTFGKDAIIGYAVGKDFKLLLVFEGGAENLINSNLNHYSVLYPAGTVNSMAGDEGRQW